MRYARGEAILRVIAMRYAPQLIVSQNEGVLLANPHSIELSGERIASYGEGRSTLDFPLIHDTQSQDQP